MNELTSEYLTGLALQSHETACAKGWWGDDAKPSDNKVGKRNMGEVFMLASSELSEGLEHYRVMKDEKLTKVLWDPSNGSDPKIELSEKYIANAKPDGFPIELADTVIRLCDNLMALIGPRVQPLFEVALHEHLMYVAIDNLCGEQRKPRSINLPERLKQIDLYISDAYRAQQMFNDPEKITISLDEKEVRGTPVFMARAVIQLFVLATDFKIDLQHALGIKAEYNTTRPYKHGGKKA